MKQITALNIQYPVIFKYSEFKYVYNYYLNHKNDFQLDLKPLSFYSIKFRGQDPSILEYFFIGGFKRLIEYNNNDISYGYVFLKIIPNYYSKLELIVDVYYLFESQLYEYIISSFPSSKYEKFITNENIHLNLSTYTFDNIRLAMKKFN